MKVIKIFILLFVLWSQLTAQFYLDGVWESIGPYGSRYNTNLKLDPRDNGRIFAFGGGTIFRSDNKGANWQNITPYMSQDSYTGNQLYINESNPERIYFMYNTDNKIFESINSGNTWSLFYSDENNYNVFFLDKNNPDILFAYKSTGGWGNYFRIILKTEDRGETWYELMNGINSQDGPVTVFINTYNPDFMIAVQEVTAGGDVVYDYKYFRSVNGGRLWQNMNVGTDTYFDSFFFDPNTPANIYTIKNMQDTYKVYKSINYGESWFEIGTGLPEPNLFNYNFKLSFTLGNSDKIFLALNSDYYLNGADIYHSGDGGMHWSLYSTVSDSRGLSKIEINPANMNEFYMTSFPQGVLYSNNQGSSWELITEGLTQTEINSFDLVDSETIFAVAGNKGIFKTTNGGVSWISLYENASSNIGKVFVSKNNNQFVFTNARIEGGNYSISNDQGGTWNTSFCDSCDLHTFDISSDDQTIYGNAYLGSNSGLAISGIMKSTNQGESWNVLDVGIDDINNVRSIKIDPADENIVYTIISTRGDVYHDYLIKTSDGGCTWNIIADSAYCLFLNYYSPEYIYYACSDKFYISNNKGLSFSVLEMEEPYQDIAFVETNPRIMIGLKSDSSIDISTDYGFTWNEIPELSGTKGIIEIEICSEEKGVVTLYGSTYTRGILKCTLSNITEINYYENRIPQNFSLYQNYPNPFNPSTTIEYFLPERSFVTIKIYNTIGETIAVLVNEEKKAGNHKMFFNAEKLSSGIYYYSMNSGNYSEIRKMVLLK